MLTVVTPAANRMLTTVERLKAQLGGVGDNDNLARKIQAASGMMCRHCDREFARQQLRLVVECPRSPVIYLRHSPVTVEAVTLGGVVLPASGWGVDAARGALFRRGPGGGFRSWDDAGGEVVEVLFWAGYVLPDDPEADGAEQLPAEVEEACLMLATSLVAGAGRDPLLRSESEEGVGASSWLDPRRGAGGMPPQVADMLEAYVRFSVA